MKEPSGRKPRFQVEDKVRITGPSARSRKENTGKVTEIIGADAGTVLRYKVQFTDGSSGTFFGFELEPDKS